MSGGQRQRLNIARTLAPEPALVICDEPVSALDVSLQAQIVALLQTLQQRTWMALLFIRHNLSVVADIATRIVVMYGGQIVEILPHSRLWTAPAYPYTSELLDAIPETDPEHRHLSALVRPALATANPATLPAGCRFQQ